MPGEDLPETTSVKPDAVVFDIDGVLACNQHRLPFIQCEQPDWEAYNAALNSDPELPLCNLVRLLLNTDVQIVLLTNRNHLLKTYTETWLLDRGLGWDLLVHRVKGADIDNFKPEMMKTIVEMYTVVNVFEDHPRLVEQFRAMGLPVVHVYSGYYDAMEVKPDDLAGAQEEAPQASTPTSP